MEILIAVTATLALIFAAIAGVIIALNAPNYGGPISFIIGLVMFIVACVMESLVIESFPYKGQIETKCVQENE